MARANRHFIPRCIWHITHRCHQAEFLLRFAHDRSRFVTWLGEARKRFGLQLLNYTVTSNHVHLLVKDVGGANTIPSAIQLIAGRTGQEYNQRKGRKGAFWKDRYHATAIETGEHVRGCLVYIDMNMVRAGVVSHPAGWEQGGYHEIQGERRRNCLLELDVLADAVGVSGRDELATAHKEWIEAALASNRQQREEVWSRSIAVGSAAFVQKTKELLGVRAKGRKIALVGDAFMLREAQERYGADFTPENRPKGVKTG